MKRAAFRIPGVRPHGFALSLWVAGALATILNMTAAEPTRPPANRLAGTAVNALGIDLLRTVADRSGNLVISPYSIQGAMVMAYGGAAGETQAEMGRVLHLGGEGAAVDDSFGALRRELESIQLDSAARGARSKAVGVESDPIQLTVANRLFGRKGFGFSPEFVDGMAKRHGAGLRELDFEGDLDGALKEINQWVAQQTQQRIPDLLAKGAINQRTPLVLVNAIYVKAAWATPFPNHATGPEPFHVKGGKAAKVPTMRLEHGFGYGTGAGYRIVTIPYTDSRLQLVILLPDSVDGLGAVEKSLSTEALAACSKLPRSELVLLLPKFRLEPPTLALKAPLQGLGMKRAFDIPANSADFSRMTGGSPKETLAIADVFHRTFLEWDEKGTEAAAATAIVMAPTSVRIEPRKPVEVRVDRPFLFAIQHVPSGACLFLGRVTDPKPARAGR